MRATLLLITALSLLAAACNGLPSGSASGAGPGPGITSYENGYGVRPNGPRNAADSHMDWGW